MNLLLLTQEEAALAGRPVNQPRMDTDRHGLGNCQIREAGTEAGFDNGRRRRGQASPFPPSDGGKDAVLTPAAGDPDAGGTRPYLRGEEEFLRLLFEFTHSAQLNPDRTIALAAKRWERTLRFRLAVTRQRRWGGRDGGKVGRWEQEKSSGGLGSECRMTGVQGLTRSGLEGGGSATGDSPHPAASCGQ